jgi:hypothetical protein
MTMALLLALALSATFATSDPARPSEQVEPSSPQAPPSPGTEGPPASEVASQETGESTVREPAASPQDAPAAGPASGGKSTGAKIVEELVIVETISAGVSGIAAFAPEVGGWAIAILGPLLATGAPADERAAAVAFGAGSVGLGLYNAFELRSSRYDRSERFWLNMAGCNAVIAGTALADWVAKPKRPTEPTPAVSVRARVAPPMLVVSGRF